MGQRVCPWWLGYLLASPLRRLLENPKTVLTPYVCEGMTVLEPGPGMGFFTLELARLVGPTGRIIAVDVQDKMLSGLKRRARRAGLLDRIDARLVPPDSMQVDDLSGRIDFTLAYAMVHELPSPASFFRQVMSASKPGAQMLVVEPAGHVTPSDFDQEIKAAEAAGFKLLERPVLSRNRAALFVRN
jgi:tRNA A58 N-methylase Trm61